MVEKGLVVLCLEIARGRRVSNNKVEVNCCGKKKSLGICGFRECGRIYWAAEVVEGLTELCSSRSFRDMWAVSITIVIIVTKMEEIYDRVA